MEHVKHKLVFIVEDNDMYSLMLDYMLSKESACRFVSFKTGEECIANLTMDPDLIILDYGLPRMNGLETFTEIKKHDSTIPVVVLTESHDVHVAQQFMHIGGLYDYLLKEKDSVRQIVNIIDAVLLGNKEPAKEEEEKKKKANRNILIGILFFFGLLICFYSLKR